MSKMNEILKIISLITSNILSALYQYFWFSMLFSVTCMFVYMFYYHPDNARKGWKTAVRTWWQYFRTDRYFRKLFFLIFYTTMILFRTLLNRNLWLNPLSDVMGGWWIWNTASDGTVTLTTECFENIALMLPFTALLLWTMPDWLLKRRTFGAVVGKSMQVAFCFSLCIELLQLFLRLGTFQFSDLFYNTLGGVLGGILYWWILKFTEKNHR